MKKTALIAMAALAVMLYSVSAFAAAATCQDWKGAWEFTYDNASTQICFDNESFLDGELVFCDNDSKDNCTCLSNNTNAKFCFDNTTFLKCDNDTKPNCVCADNPYYPLTKGKKAVTIDNATANLTFLGKTAPCLATGKKGSTAVTIVQVDNATAVKLDIAKLTYIVFEGTFDNVTFAQILPANFKKGSDNTTFTAEKNFNFLGLMSGIKNDNETIPPVECELNIIPKKIFRLLAFVNPISPFVIIAPRDSDIEFARPIDIDWGTEAINDIIRIRIGKKLIFGLGFARPFKLEAGEFQVDVTYGDNGTACGTIEVK